jgi:uncharacterized protein (DUF952 family)
VLLTYHGTPCAVWEAAAGSPDYRPEPFESDGFIHTSIGAPVLAAALNRYYRDDPRPYVALVIDLDSVTARWDVARYDGVLGEFPHIHGPLNRDAVLRVVPLERGPDGEFLEPADE